AAWTAAADPDRWVRLLHRSWPLLRVAQRHDPPVVGHDLAGEQALHDLERVLEQIEPGRRRRERDAQLDMLLVEPRGAERELETAMRRVVDRQRLRGEHRRMPVGDARNEKPETD